MGLLIGVLMGVTLLERPAFGADWFRTLRPEEVQIETLPREKGGEQAYVVRIPLKDIRGFNSLHLNWAIPGRRESTHVFNERSKRLANWENGIYSIPVHFPKEWPVATYRLKNISFELDATGRSDWRYVEFPVSAKNAQIKVAPSDPDTTPPKIRINTLAVDLKPYKPIQQRNFWNNDDTTITAKFFCGWRGT